MKRLKSSSVFEVVEMYVLKQLVFFLFTHSIWTEKFHRLLKHFPRETINILLAKGSFHNLHLLESDNNQSRKYEYDMSTNATLKWGTRKKKGNGTTVLTQIGSTVAEYTFQDFNFHLFALCGFVSCFFSSLQRVNDARQRTMCFFFSFAVFSYYLGWYRSGEMC